MIDDSIGRFLENRHYLLYPIDGAKLRRCFIQIKGLICSEKCIGWLLRRPNNNARLYWFTTFSASTFLQKNL